MFKSEAELRQQLEKFPPGEHEQRLIRGLAEANLRAGHESAYRRIFGSQIMALQRLDQRGGTATVSNARAFYDQLPALWPAMYPNYSFDNWLNFALSSQLAARVGDMLTITAYGHDFIVWLAANKVVTDKPF